MSLTRDEVGAISAFEAAVRLVDSALLHPGGPSDPAYQALVHRYQDDGQMQACVNDVARAKDIRVLSCEAPFGLLYVAEKDCRLTQSLSKIPRWSQASPLIRAAIAAGIPFVAACFYPTSDTVEDPKHLPPPRSTLEIAQDFVDACKSIATMESDDRPAEQLWRGILDIREVEPDPSGKTRSRKPDTVEGVIALAIALMVDWGYLKYMSTDDKRVYPTRKLPAAMRESIVPHFYAVAREYSQSQQESGS
ncbi:hypothetical protein AA309_18650 [Microvirga vignae]|uniref:Uncharacterized protein n=1 Tax=Microvirga vignae TaxID=1225564 RepID=A0A0H1RA15_9HYPH|nr:hypothetical protein [Microvirga vignae]KLK91711.1 hypothetical protein AA309_18650 [Microvirga vignae]